MKNRRAFRANDRVFIQIEKFSATVLTLVLAAELGFRHGWTSKIGWGLAMRAFHRKTSALG
jgi:hypothetical protein